MSLPAANVGLWFWTLVLSLAPLAGAAPTPPALTNAAQLRVLSPEEAARKSPVSLRGVVTAINPGLTVFIQDQTGGTFVMLMRGPHGNLERLIPGDVVEVTGASYQGRFVPGIQSASFLVLGHGEMPEAVPVSYDDLLSARWHYQRVAIRGIVRSIGLSRERRRCVLTLAVGPRKLEVPLLTLEYETLPPLVDAQVLLKGLAAGHINERRQLISPQLVVSRAEDVQVEVAPPTDPFSAPLRTGGTLQRFDSAGLSGHRVRVQGVVTFQQPGKAIYLRDAERGLLVETAQDQPVQPGDRIEVVGFPAMGWFSAFLEDAEFRLLGSEPPPLPMTMTVGEALLGTNDANLVTLDGQLLEVLQTPGESVLVVRADQNVFHARLNRTRIDVRNGSQVRLTGICRVAESRFREDGFGARPGAIELLLRSPSDLVVQAAAPWWTTGRLAVAVGLLLLAALAALVWIALLRQRVAEQAAVIREKVQREAALEERHRMAREMHDTLAQSFSGLGFQLEGLLARLPPEAEAARAQLEVARQMVRYGQEGFRRSLLNLRAQELERGSLADVLPGLARHITADTGIDLHCAIQDGDCRLPEIVEANLLRIGQECLTNAVRHGRPKRIDLVLQRQNGAFEMRVADDGIGFDPRVTQLDHNGHFGWRGIRERAEQIRARLTVDSKPGQGTTIVVSVPL